MTEVETEEGDRERSRIESIGRTGLTGAGHDRTELIHTQGLALSEL